MKRTAITKALALLLAATLCVLSFAACGKADAGTKTTDPAAGTEEEAKTPVLTPESTKIALLLCSAEMKSASARAAWLVLEKFSKETGIQVKWWMLPTSDDLKENLDDIIAQGYNIIITNNGLHTEYIKERSPDLVDVTFVAMEGFFTPKGENEALANLPNLIQGTVRAEESAFIAGYLLAKRTENGKIGMLNGTKNPPGFQMEAGFRAGVAYAEQELGKTIETRIEYVGNGFDRTGGKNTANLLYNSGCDLIYICAGGETDWGALEAAKAQQKPCITAGHTSYIAPESVVAEVLKSKDPVLTAVLNGLYYGTMERGQVLDHGLNDGSTGLAKTALTDAFFGDALLKELEAVTAQIQSGAIQVPQDLNP
ncbi:MAG: BMP family ABC transporter substrate-binding protein [Oscillospiraceae bacterium]|jgi:basic membrane protein A|nr:BMP family ABC transporter substrate-binding protein [Oscillospiraceae bacterium]